MEKSGIYTKLSTFEPSYPPKFAELSTISNGMLDLKDFLNRNRCKEKRNDFIMRTEKRDLTS